MSILFLLLFLLLFVPVLLFYLYSLFFKNVDLTKKFKKKLNNITEVLKLRTEVIKLRSESAKII